MMRELSMKELREYQVGILDVVMNFCQERGINCWLNGGTLLGAVRHKGYIPWDDDIDLGMLRPDYDRFMKEFNGTYPRYEFHCIENDSKCIYPFGKVMDKSTLLVEEGIPLNVNIDIFVFDNAPDDNSTARKMFRIRKLYNMLNYRRVSYVFALSEKHRKRNFARRLTEYIVRALLRVFPRTYFTRKWIDVSRECISMQTKRVGNFVGFQDVMMDREAMSLFVELEFEGKMYKAPVGYDEFLRALYGDYMQFPPIEERTKTHQFTAYAKD